MSIKFDTAKDLADFISLFNGNLPSSFSASMNMNNTIVDEEEKKENVSITSLSSDLEQESERTNNIPNKKNALPSSESSIIENIISSKNKPVLTKELNDLGFYSINQLLDLFGLKKNYHASLAPILQRAHVKYKKIGQRSLYYDLTEVLTCVSKSDTIAKETLQNHPLFKYYFVKKGYGYKYPAEDKADFYKFIDEGYALNIVCAAYNIKLTLAQKWLDDRKSSKFESNLSNEKLEKQKKEKRPLSEYEKEYTDWRNLQYATVKAKGQDVGKILSCVFKKMTTTYGINWMQVRKDYYNYFNVSTSKTIELAYFLQYIQEHSDREHYENLFESVLSNTLEEIA